MARSYGRFTTSIYRDKDFRALTFAQQGIYFMLGLQPEMTGAGTLALTQKRWAAMAAEATTSDLRRELGVLETRGHIVLDDDTEELLIVKFVKWDGGIGNEKRRPVIQEAALGVSSTRIRHTLAREIGHLDYRDMASLVCPDWVSGTQCGNDRGVVEIGEYVPSPLPQSHSTPREPQPVGATAPDGLSPFCPDHQPNGTSDPCGPCGTWGLAYRLKQKRQADEAIAAKQARTDAAKTAADCPYCQGGTWRIDNPAVKCDHLEPTLIGADS